MAIDQAFGAPIFSAIFLGYTAAAEGLGWQGIQARVSQQLPLLWRDSVCFWSIAHCVTFNIPVPVRVLWQDTARIYYGTLMSLRGSAPVDDGAPDRRSSDGRPD